MSKPIVLSADCAANAVLSRQFLEADGAGALKQFDGVGVPLGLAESDKDSENRVGCIKQAYMKVPTTNAAYNFGDEVEFAAGHVVQALAAGVKVGRAAESKTTTATDNELLVYFNFE